MKQFCFNKWLANACLLVLIMGCDHVEPPIFDNPYDTENPNFRYPNATITTPTNGQVLEQSSVILSWVGIYSASSFAYKLEGREDEFSSWSTGTTVTYPYMDEGSYTFYIKEKIETYEQTEPTILTFIVDALPQTSLILMRWYNRVPINTENYVDVWLEEVSQFKGITTQIQTNGNITVTRIEKNSELLESEGGRWLQMTNSIDEINRNHVLIFDGILLGGNTNGFTGDTPFCRIYYQATDDNQLTFIADSTQVRDITNKPIGVNTFRNGIIDIY